MLLSLVPPLIVLWWKISQKECRWNWLMKLAYVEVGATLWHLRKLNSFLCRQRTKAASLLGDTNGQVSVDNTCLPLVPCCWIAEPEACESCLPSLVCMGKAIPENICFDCLSSFNRDLREGKRLIWEEFHHFMLAYITSCTEGDDISLGAKLMNLTWFFTGHNFAVFSNKTSSLCWNSWHLPAEMALTLFLLKREKKSRWPKRFSVLPNIKNPKICFVIVFAPPHLCFFLVVSILFFALPTNLKISSFPPVFDEHSRCCL